MYFGTCKFGLTLHSKWLKEIVDILVIAVFTYLTWTVNNAGKFGPVAASSAIGLIVGLLDEERAVGIFTGTFAAMVSENNIWNSGWVVLLGILTALIFKICTHFNFANGVGGRLGLMAQVGCSITLSLQYLKGITSSSTFFDPREYEVLSSSFLLLMIILTPVAAACTMYLRCNVPSICNPVTASSVIGLFGSAISFGLGGRHSVFAKDASLAIYTGSFVGMSSSNRIPNYSGFLLVGFLAGSIHIGFLGIFTGGYGGKLGTIAFLSTLLFQVLLPVWPQHKWSLNNRTKEEGASVAPSSQVGTIYSGVGSLLNYTLSPKTSSSMMSPEDSDDPDDEDGEFGYRYGQLFFKE
mmetsp:Transcript_30158/g.39729  ORF Transcript_30158/g.39729 Transcript_30158/m.39729 type:complete len:352 (-) Transcript_30158:106-1161(-)